MTQDPPIAVRIVARWPRTWPIKILSVTCCAVIGGIPVMMVALLASWGVVEVNQATVGTYAARDKAEDTFYAAVWANRK